MSYKQKTKSLIPVNKVSWGSKKCVICGNPFWMPKSRLSNAMFCSSKCYARHRLLNIIGWKHSKETKEKLSTQKTGKKNPMYGKNGMMHHNWKGGVSENNGYLRRTLGKREYLHRQVLKDKEGRDLTTEEISHHINGNKKDNCPDNLTIYTRREHPTIHARMRAGKNELSRM